MDGGQLYSLSNVHTLGQASVAIMLVVQLIKPLPVLSFIPTRILTVIVGVIFFVATTSPLPSSRAGWVLIILNGHLSATSAIGGWHLLYGPSSDGISNPKEAEAMDMDTRAMRNARRVNWCKTVIHHEAIRAKHKYERWDHEGLWLNAVTEREEEWIESMKSESASDALQQMEMILLLKSLPAQECDVLYPIFCLCETEQTVAKSLHLSQQQVSRIKQRALLSLRMVT